MKTIRPLELEALLEKRQPVEILDLRPHAKFEEAHINGARSFPSAEITPETLLSSRALLASKPIYLVSESGALAQLHAHDLVRVGLDNLVVLSGGMHAWRGDGLPLVRNETSADWREHGGREKIPARLDEECVCTGS